MRHRSGVVSEVNVTWGTPGAPQGPWFRVCGEAGCLYDWNGLWLHRKGEERRSIETEPEEVTLVREIEHFLECVETGTEPLVTGEVGREALRLVLAAYRSMATGEAVGVG
jgi:predicted dehydrogenase